MTGFLSSLLANSSLLAVVARGKRKESANRKPATRHFWATRRPALLWESTGQVLRALAGGAKDRSTPAAANSRLFHLCPQETPRRGAVTAATEIHATFRSSTSAPTSPLQALKEHTPPASLSLGDGGMLPACPGVPGAVPHQGQTALRSWSLSPWTPCPGVSPENRKAGYYAKRN